MAGASKGNTTVFALLTMEAGSYTLGEHRFPALQIAPVPAAAAELADPAVSPVRFYDKQEDAAKALQAMQARIEARTNPKPQ